jgi:hypothetical protein
VAFIGAVVLLALIRVANGQRIFNK